jgi:hypothetical protein
MGRNAVLAIDVVQEGSAVEVRDIQGCKGVFASDDIDKDSIIFHLKGIISSEPTKFTIQIAGGCHLTLPAMVKTDDRIDYCWQYLNHNCDPNGYINTAELTFRALRDIAAGEEINFNYLTTESEMAVPFTCTCGSTNCFGLIRGRNFLTPSELERLSGATGEDSVAPVRG